MADRIYTVETQIPVRGNVAGELVDQIEVHWAGPANTRGWVRVRALPGAADVADQLIRRQLDEQLRIAALGAE